LCGGEVAVTFGEKVEETGRREGAFAGVQVVVLLAVRPSQYHARAGNLCCILGIRLDWRRS
jgi:hypothetical protein